MTLHENLLAIGILSPFALTSGVIIWLERWQRPVWGDAAERPPFHPLELLGLWAMLFAMVVLTGVLLHQLQWVPEGSLQEAAPRQVMWMSVLAQVIPLGGLALMYGWRVRQCGRWRQAGLAMHPLADVLRAVVALLVMLPWVLLTAQLATLVGLLMGYPASEIGHELLLVVKRAADEDPLALWGLIFSTLVLAPLLEEIIFRGYFHSCLLAILKPHRRWMVIVIASLFFAAIHSKASWQALPALFVLSLGLGWLYERTGRLWPSILLHMLFNAFNVAMLLAFYESSS